MTEVKATRERVHAAAVRLFAERGFHGTGIRDLADAAGLSSATLYHYMGSKEDLLVEVMAASLDRLDELADAATAGVDDPVERLAALVRTHVREHARGQLQTSVGDGEIRALDEARRADVVRRRDRYEARWQQTLESGRRTGLMRVDDPALTRLALLDLCSGVSRWYSPAGRLGLDDLAERYVGLALDLVRAGAVRR